ncbi:MAG: YqaE/Pmp3 family membrane protein [Rhodomicrobium sp.]
MRFLLALLLPWVVFFTVGKPVQGFICLALQLTLIGWIPATIWALMAVSAHSADKRTDKIVRAIQTK